MKTINFTGPISIFMHAPNFTIRYPKWANDIGACSRKYTNFKWRFDNLGQKVANKINATCTRDNENSCTLTPTLHHLDLAIVTNAAFS